MTIPSSTCMMRNGAQQRRPSAQLDAAQSALKTAQGQERAGWSKAGVEATALREQVSTPRLDVG